MPGRHVWPPRTPRCTAAYLPFLTFPYQSPLTMVGDRKPVGSQHTNPANGSSAPCRFAAIHAARISRWQMSRAGNIGPSTDQPHADAGATGTGDMSDAYANACRIHLLTVQRKRQRRPFFLRTFEAGAISPRNLASASRCIPSSASALPGLRFLAWRGAPSTHAALPSDWHSLQAAP